MLTCHSYVQIDSGHGRLVDNVGGTTICKNFNYTYPSTIFCVQYLKILLSSLREFQRVYYVQIVFGYCRFADNGVAPPFEQTNYTYPRTICYLCAISKNSSIM